MVGNGIRPKWNLPTPLKTKIEKEFNRWAESKRIDWADKLTYYGLQALAAREIFAAGEVLCRRHIRPISWGMRVPLQLQLIESEQMPVWVNTQGFATVPIGIPDGNAVRTGIEFDPDNRITAYHLYKEHPGETMFYPLQGLQFMRVRSADMLHVYKPWQAGLLRGQPHLTPVLVLLHEIQKYMDASVVKKQIQTMFAAFIKKASPEGSVLPQDMWGQNGLDGSAGYNNGGLPTYGPPPPGVDVSSIETGTIQNLFPGEEIQFPTLPQENDMQAFLYEALHQLASAIGCTYEQLTGNLKGVNLSSIRAGILDFRRKAVQFVRNILIAQFCEPVVGWFLEEAVMSGALKLPGYSTDPAKYLDIEWSLSSWPWIDPKSDIEAAQAEVRNGFNSRESICAERGRDVADVDAQTVRDNARSDQMGLVRDSDPRRVLIGRESNPLAPAPDETPAGKEETDQEEQSGQNTGPQVQD
jgi:lambda family phage portal protein